MMHDGRYMREKEKIAEGGRIRDRQGQVYIFTCSETEENASTDRSVGDKKEERIGRVKDLH